MHSCSSINLWLYSIPPSLLLLYLSMLTSTFSSLSSHCYRVLEFYYALVLVGYVQTISTGVGQAFFSQLVLPLAYHIYHHFGLDLFLYDCKSNVNMHFITHLLVMSSFYRPTFCTIQYSRSNRRSIKLAF
jgi:hypothetical protein